MALKISIPEILAALRSCRGARDLHKGMEIHRGLVESGKSTHIFVSNSLIAMYSRCGCALDARRIFDTMPRHSLISWSALIAGYAQNGEGDLALELFSRIDGGQIDSRLFVAALNACSRLAVKESGRDDRASLLDKGRSIHDQLREDDHESNLFVANALVDMYSKLGSMVDARTVFERMLRRDAVTWGALILGYAHSGDGEIGLSMLSRMEDEGCEPDPGLFAAALKACSCVAEKELGRVLNGKMVKSSSLDRGRALHAKAAEMGSERDLSVANALVDLYCKCGSMTDARRVFERMPEHSLASWDAIITGYAQIDEGEIALELFQRMESEGFVPDARLFMAALRACGSIAALESGRGIHARIDASLLQSDVILANSLVSFYAKCGSMDDAKQVFDSIREKDTFTWSSLIAGYSHQGDAGRVFDLFETMQTEMVKPNAVTYLSVLTVCSHAGLVDQGKRYFSEMRSVHSIDPSIEHYICMIDLLARGNQLEQAVALLGSMPYVANLVAWRTILSAARKWKNVRIGKLAFESILKLDERDDASYLLMGNVYAAAGLWSEFDRIQGLRREARCPKKLGQSWWIDSSGRVHRFVVGDTTHLQNEQILAKFGEILSRMKEEAGYSPRIECVPRNLLDDEKESALCGHSEKLAICCALINTRPGTGIRVTKNLRVCDDCHRVSAIVSKLEGRTIICRDAVRFHVFEDGRCSCHDFW